MNDKKVLLMYSGGLDSLLSCIRLINEGFKVYLIHFDNGSTIGTENINEGIKLNLNKYKNNVEYIGIASTVGFFRDYRGILNIENCSFEDLSKQYPGVSISQYRCLMCRMAMYTYSIALAKSLGISNIAEGARKSQLFGIEQKALLTEFEILCNKYGLSLLLPVFDLEEDIIRDNELLRNGITPIAYESKCLLGYPMNDELNIEQIETLRKMYVDLRNHQEEHIEDSSFQYMLKTCVHDTNNIEWK